MDMPKFPSQLLQIDRKTVNLIIRKCYPTNLGILYFHNPIHTCSYQVHQFVGHLDHPGNSRQFKYQSFSYQNKILKQAYCTSREGYLDQTYFQIKHCLGTGTDRTGRENILYFLL